MFDCYYGNIIEKPKTLKRCTNTHGGERQKRLKWSGGKPDDLQAATSGIISGGRCDPTAKTHSWKTTASGSMENSSSIHLERGLYMYTVRIITCIS